MSETPIVVVTDDQALDLIFSVVRSRDLPTGQGPRGMFALTNQDSSETWESWPFGRFSRAMRATANSQ
ncbi:uncharacterized protein N7500_006909 [Penicillium coprophilum]|uniref:uncharacterized protein n=1 Tax=Penicillium coprophilum TaxID=36646 RepID=UPI00239F57CE|nr:uncharacterized protein N7500_006909 [Penicillium coprophilum]KAJ5165079.1 hypothetical protein N7500_006909 [Penicillium coprophilum]